MRLSKFSLSVNLAMLLWIVGVLAPLTAYAQPLWQNALSDTPTAYLIWVPVLAVIWGTWSLLTTPDYPDDAEVNGILGVGLLALVGSALVIGPIRLPYNFLWNNEGLLFWPLWMIGMTWLLFGLRATRRILGPTLFLLLAWPPVLTTLATLTQDILLKAAIAGLTPLHNLVSWFRVAQVSGNFLVHSGTQWVPVIVSQACSGADSALGAAILMPLLFAIFRGSIVKKALLGLFAVAGSLLLNLLRLVLIVGSLHYAGSHVAFDVIHPILGFILFGLLGIAMVGVANMLHLRSDLQVTRPILLRRPGLTRTVLACGAMVSVFVLLLPFLSLPAGAIGKPLPVASGYLQNPLPQVQGFTAFTPRHFDDSSILGSGARSVAITYVAHSGMSILAEEWSTPNLGNLTAYGFHNCLLFHGDTIMAEEPVTLAHGVVGTDYLVRLPGAGNAVYVDLEWDAAVQFPDGTVSYMRFAVAAFPYGNANLWPPSLTHVHAQPAQGLWALAGHESFGSWRGYESTKQRVEAFGVELVRAVQTQVGIEQAAIAPTRSAGS